MHYATNSMHYSKEYSQDHCQNNLLTFEMILIVMQDDIAREITNFNNILTVLLKYINLFSMTY